MKLRAWLVALSLLLPSAARADEVTLIAPGGIRAAIEKMIPEFERTSGHTVKATFGSGGGTKQQVIRGEAFDVPIVQPPIDPVTASGHVVGNTATALAVVPVAIAVRKGAPKPDISTPDALRRTLLNARSVSYPNPSGGAAAGVSFEQTLKMLGIAPELEPKFKRAQGGAAAMAMLARGDVEIGVTFMSEMEDPGIDRVGPLPLAVSTPTALVGFVSTHAKSPDAARALLRYLSSPAAARVYAESGMRAGSK
jgi:molybdate transport system substrate-binding protein